MRRIAIAPNDAIWHAQARAPPWACAQQGTGRNPGGGSLALSSPPPTRMDAP
jgi:hypothetical protein